LPYASLDAQMEALRPDYWDAVSRSQTHLWTEEADLEPWLVFFLEVLGRHRSDVEARIAAELRVQDLPPLQRAILEAVQAHGSVDAALLLRETGANRNTLKDNLRRLVRGGVIEKIGERRATRYRMPGAGRPGGREAEPNA
jgi:Fic family protein